MASDDLLSAAIRRKPAKGYVPGLESAPEAPESRLARLTEQLMARPENAPIDRPVAPGPIMSAPPQGFAGSFQTPRQAQDADATYAQRQALQSQETQSSLEGLKRAILREAPEGQEFQPLWTGDDTRFEGPFNGGDVLKQTYQQRHDERAWDQHRNPGMTITSAGFPIKNPNPPQPASGGWGAFLEGTFGNQATLSQPATRNRNTLQSLQLAASQDLRGKRT